jgi:hypothetical protein
MKAKAMFGGLLVVTFVATLLLARHQIVRLPRLGVQWPIFIAPPPDYDALRPGVEIAFIFVGSPTCAYSNAPELPALIEEAKRHLREHSVRRGVSFATVGVSQHRSARAGINYLGKFGSFNELSAGRSWYNGALLKYVHDGFLGPAATPQILLVERILGSEEHPKIRNERVLLRQVGLGSIHDWVKRGAPIPQGELGQQP